MKRRSKAGGKLLKARRRKMAPRKSGNAPKAARRSSTAASLGKKVARLTRERDEALARENATGEILASISGSLADTRPVFDAILRNLLRLFGTRFAVVLLLRDGQLELGGLRGDGPEFEKLAERYPVPLDNRTLPGKAILTGQALQLVPIVGSPKAPRATAQWAHEFGYNALLSVPMIRQGKVIGALNTAHRDAVPFTDQQIALIKSFADQAVIAIENVRLFEAEQQRSAELAESLEQQTATAEVLKVISSSPGELEPVFQSLLRNATQICGAGFGNLFLQENGLFRIVAMHNAPPAYAGARADTPRHPRPDTALGRLVRTQQAVQIPDLKGEPGYISRDPFFVAGVELGGIRTILAVPMHKDNKLIGAISIYRQEVKPFTDKQIALIKNFAAQAVIAIENTRLLDELRESLDQQTATSEVLKVISSSPGELEPVFQAMLENATRICQARFGVLSLREDDAFRVVSMHNAPAAFVELRRREPTFQPSGRMGDLMEQAFATKRAVQLADIAEDLASKDDPLTRSFSTATEARSIILVPLIKENEVIGSMAVFRQEVRPFNDKQVELLTNFAAQAVIAIENTRLLNELRQRTTDLTESLESLRTAQDRLVQTEKLASLGQLTAGIAHEIKNPLNFVNNFSSVSIELIDELREALSDARIDAKRQADVNEIADMLQGNLDKVVQHGKRADSIVKNMLLHSRAGSGEHRPVDINALVEESLNLAYHGARAEKQDFNITLERSFDPTAGEVDLFPQEITRVLLNLIANAFYATAKRAALSGGDGYDPTLSIGTQNLGDSVEIRIRDNGTGIPAGVKDKMFNPFFTTKPAGEGTGLGLSISHDIVVKQHAGSITVDTEPGKFTEFKIVLPRAGPSPGKSGERG